MPIKNFLSLVQNIHFQPLSLISTCSMLLRYEPKLPSASSFSGMSLNCLAPEPSDTRLNYKTPISYLSISTSLNCRHPSSYPLSGCMTLKCPLSDTTLNCAHHMACDLACDGPRDEPLVPDDVIGHHTLDPLQTLIERLHKSSQLDPNNTSTCSLWLHDSTIA